MRLVPVILAIAAILTLAACGGGSAATPSPSPQTLTVNGDITLHDVGTDLALACRTQDCPPGFGLCLNESDGYSDISAGGSVVVKDSAGTTIATGELGKGTDIDTSYCRYSFTVPNVPISNFYSIAIGHRNGITFSQADVESGAVHITLGN